MKNHGYMVKLPNEDRYWSEDAKGFVSLDDPIKPTIMDLDWAYKFAWEYGVESQIIYKICISKNNCNIWFRFDDGYF